MCSVAVRLNFDESIGLLTGAAHWRGDFYLPLRWFVEVDDDSCPYLVRLEIVVEGHDPTLCGVRFERRSGGPPVSARGVRQVRLDEYLRLALRSSAYRAVGGRPEAGFERVYKMEDFDAEPLQPDERLDAVAEVYRTALQAGQAPRMAVQEDPRWGPLPANTAARWIREARDAGRLEDVEQTRKSSNRRKR